MAVVVALLLAPEPVPVGKGSSSIHDKDGWQSHLPARRQTNLSRSQFSLAFEGGGKVHEDIFCGSCIFIQVLGALLLPMW